MTLTIIIPAIGEDINHAHYLASVLRSQFISVLVIQDKKYGESVKQGIRIATTEWVGTMDADGQHEVTDLLQLEHGIATSSYDMLIGLRPEWTKKRSPSLTLNILASFLARRWVPDFGSGMRIFRRDLALSYFPILPDGFAFNAALTMSFLADHCSVGWKEIQVGPRRWGKSHVRPFRDGLSTFYHLTRIGLALRTRGVRAWLRSHRM